MNQEILKIVEKMQKVCENYDKGYYSEQEFIRVAKEINVRLQQQKRLKDICKVCGEEYFRENEFGRMCQQCEKNAYMPEEI